VTPCLFLSTYLTKIWPAAIEVRFKDYGLKSLEVIDNGSGIAPENYESIGKPSSLVPSFNSFAIIFETALKHHTSKLASFSDLTSVLTFGFRGEALSSLCALSETVTVTTATATQAPMGTILVFDKTGRLTSSNGKVARQVSIVLYLNMNSPIPFHVC
jgi:DNA mismatch repair protein PMS2